MASVAVEEVDYQAIVKEFAAKMERKINEVLEDDRDIIMAAITTSQNALVNGAYDCPSVLKYTSKRLRDDKEVVMAAVLNNSDELEYASDRLKGDQQLLMASALHGKEHNSIYVSTVLKYCTWGFTTVVAKNLCMAVVSKNSVRLEDPYCESTPARYFPSDLCDDKELMMVANHCMVEEPGVEFEDWDSNFVIGSTPYSNGWGDHDGRSYMAICYASDRLKCDKEYVLDAVSTNAGLPLQYASAELRKDEDVIKAAMGAEFADHHEEIIMSWTK